jgi:hypothetical protein
MNIYPNSAQIIRRLREISWRFLNKNYIAGRLVEIFGNQVIIDGHSFELSNPYISTFLKSRFLFKTYEKETRYLVKKYLKPNLPVVEFGGCIGVVSCLANNMLIDPELHVVVEAQPHLIDTLTKHREINKCKFKIIHAALAYDTKKVNF